MFQTSILFVSGKAWPAISSRAGSVTQPLRAVVADVDFIIPLEKIPHADKSIKGISMKVCAVDWCTFILLHRNEDLMLGHSYLYTTRISVFGCHLRKSHDGVINFHICAWYMLLCVYYQSSHWGRHTHLIYWSQSQKLSPYLREPITLVLAHHPSPSTNNVSASGMKRHDCPHLDVESVKEKRAICFFPSAACLPFKCHCEHLDIFEIIYVKAPRAHAHAAVARPLLWNLCCSIGAAVPRWTPVSSWVTLSLQLSVTWVWVQQRGFSRLQPERRWNINKNTESLSNVALWFVISLLFCAWNIVCSCSSCCPLSRLFSASSSSHSAHLLSENFKLHLFIIIKAGLASVSCLMASMRQMERCLLLVRRASITRDNLEPHQWDVSS